MNILITGASSGIGAALARIYAKPDVRLFITGRNEQRLTNVATECRQLGAFVQEKIIDVVDYKNLQEWVTNIDKKNPIDIIIANAGVGKYLPPNYFETFTEMKEIFDINVIGVFAVISPLIKPMIQRGKGSIVMISSLGALLSAPQCPTYCASKAAITSFFEGFRYKLLPHGIKSYLVIPGYVKTRMTDPYIGPKPLLMTTEKAAFIIKKQILKKKEIIIFPKRIYYLTRFLQLIPKKLLLLLFKRISSL